MDDRKSLTSTSSSSSAPGEEMQDGGPTADKGRRGSTPWSQKFNTKYLFKRGSDAVVIKSRAEYIKVMDSRPRSSSMDVGYQGPLISSLQAKKLGLQATNTPPNSVENLSDAYSGGGFLNVGSRRQERRGSYSFEPPKNTITHIATPDDSLASVAVSYKTTTSELRKINRLMTSLIHPGQILLVPVESYVSSTYSPNLERKVRFEPDEVKEGSKKKEKKDKKNKSKNKKSDEKPPNVVPVFTAEVPYLIGFRNEDALMGLLTISPADVRFEPESPSDDQKGIWDIVTYRMGLGDVLRSVKISDVNPMLSLVHLDDLSMDALSVYSHNLDLSHTDSLITSRAESPVGSEYSIDTPHTDHIGLMSHESLPGGAQRDGSAQEKPHDFTQSMDQVSKFKIFLEPPDSDAVTQRPEYSSLDMENDLQDPNSANKYLRIKLGTKVQPTVSSLIESSFKLWSMPQTSQITESWTRHCFAIPTERIDELRDYLMLHYRNQFVKATMPAPKEKEKEKLVQKASVESRILRRNLSVLEMYSLPLPEMSQPTNLITDFQIRILMEHLPPMADGRPWRLVYSTDRNGFSLTTLYRCTSQLESPSLVLIQDTEEKVFGAMLPCSLRCHEGYYGTGESFLFKFHPIFKKFPWAGKNDYFINGNPTNLSIGSSGGAYGLWMDDDLHRGRTEKCETYENEPLTTSQDFLIKSIEVWGYPFKL